MFKKTLVAAALAGALVGSAFAANVSLYGKVDAGLIYQHQKVEGFKSATQYDSTNTFKLNSGVDSSSRFGLKGSEELGNGYTVSFKLENGFNGDDGQLKQDGRLFGREASLTVSGPFGALSAGRMGGVGSAAGTYDTVYAIGDAFDGGASLGLSLQQSDRYDNMLTYQTPKFSGLQATVQYSFEKNSAEKQEGNAKANRYTGFALTGEFGNFQAVAAYERQLWSNTSKNDDQNTYYLGGNYDFGVAKVFILGQYFDGARKVGLTGWGFENNVDGKSVTTGFTNSANRDTTDGYKGYGLHLGTVIPVAGGDATFGLYYANAKTDTLAALAAGDTSTLKEKVTSYGAAARYEYPLSKRTTVYTGVEYYYEKADLSGTRVDNTFQDGKSTNVGAYVGLIHNF